MEFRTTYRQMDASPTLSHYAKTKILETVQKYVPNPIEIHLKFSIQHAAHQTTGHVFAGEGFDIWVKNSAPSMYAALEGLISKLDARLRRHKDKLRSLNIKRIEAGVREQHQNYYEEETSRNSL